MTHLRSDAAAVAGRLEQLRGSFAVDGYELQVSSATSDALHVCIVALPDACADCLAPPDVIGMIISGAVDGQYTADEVHVQMPSGS